MNAAASISIIESYAYKIQKDFPELSRGFLELRLSFLDLAIRIKSYDHEKYGGAGLRILENAVRYVLKGWGDEEGQVDSEEYSVEINKRNKERYLKSGLSRHNDDLEACIKQGRKVRIRQLRKDGTLWEPEDIRFLGILSNSYFFLHKDGTLNYSLIKESINQERNPKLPKRTNSSIEEAVRKYYPQFIKKNKNSVDWNQSIYLSDNRELLLSSYLFELSTLSRYKKGTKRVKMEKIVKKLNRNPQINSNGEITSSMARNKLRRYKKQVKAEELFFQ